MPCLPDQFLFVNKSANSKSLSHSYHDERFDIQSHVQSRQKKETKAPTKNATTNSALNLTHRRTKCGKATSQFTYTESFSGPLDTATLNPHRSSSHSFSIQEDRAQNQQKKIVSKPSKFATSGDPFDCTSVCLDPATHRLLRYPFTTFIESVFHAESLCLASGDRPGSSKKSFRHQRAVAERLNRCVQDELVLYATLSYSSSCIRWSTGEQQTEKPPEYYMLKAIELLRSRLERLEFVDGWLIVAMYALSVTELWAENSKTAVFHLKALRYCIERKGGMRSLEPYVMESLILSDKYAALLNETAPMLPFDWDPGPLPDEKAQKLSQKLDVATSGIGTGFLRSPDQDGLNPDLLFIISDIVQCVQFAATVPIASDQDEQWLFLRHSAFMYRLLGMDLSAQPFSECCRLALIIWLLKITAYNGARKHIKRLLPRLKAEMTFLDIEYQANALERWHKGVLLWVASVGAMGSEYTDERDWFIEQTSFFGNSLNLLLEKETYKSFLRNFLFINAEEGLNFARIVRRAKEMQGETVPYV